VVAIRFMLFVIATIALIILVVRALSLTLFADPMVIQ
jgi:hypothetical protein